MAKSYRVALTDEERDSLLSLARKRTARHHHLAVHC